MVSVLFPFFNNAATVVRALRSVLRQTVSNLEVVAIDDGSDDDSYRRVAAVKDVRVRLFRNERNLGVAKTRNRAIDLARGDFLAPMDADDVSHPRRLEWILAVMREQPRIAICGGWMRVHRQHHQSFVMRYPTAPAAVEAMFLWDSPFCCASVVVRRELVVNNGIRYPEHHRTGEDVAFNEQVVRQSAGTNVPKVVYHYMLNSHGLTATVGPDSPAELSERYAPTIERLLGRAPTTAELSMHAAIAHGLGAPSVAALMERMQWIDQLVQANERARIYDVEGLKAASAMIWFRVCRNSAGLGLAALRSWREARFSAHYRPATEEWMGFAGSLVKEKILSRLGARHSEGA